MEETTDLTRGIGGLIEALLRQWRLIIGLSLLCAFSAGLLSVSQPRQFRASTLVATTKVTSAVSFGSSIQTLSEEELLVAGPGTYRLVDPGMRLQTYLQLVKNPAIAQVILDQYSTRLGEAPLTVADVLEWVSGEIAEGSDAIRISVTYQNPALAAEIANTWAQEYVRQINTVYSASANSAAYESIKEQSIQAKADYENAQADLEAFIAQDRANELNRMIEERQQSLTSVQEALSILVTEIITQSSQATLKSYSESLNDLQTRLEQAYADQRRTGRLLDDVEDMRAQVQAGGDAAAASSALALTLLKAQVYAANGGLSETLQFQTQPISTTAAAMANDLGAMAETLQSRESALQARIEDLSSQLLSSEPVTNSLAIQAAGVVQAANELVGLDEVLDLSASDSPVEAARQELEAQVRELQSQLARENARLQELARARDLAWETYKNLATREAELSVVLQTASTEVAIAAPAAVPTKDIVSGARNTIMAAVVGAILGVFAVFTLEFWWSYKGVEPQPVTLKYVLRRRDIKP